jgi:Histidine kinase-, DNA gyrase B-, and HSP90-like ATPase
MSSRLAPDTVRGMLKARDPFELIRWLAYSQPDPRKALAELIQNSLDAGASAVRVTRARDGGAACLRIFDDGSGVIPEMERREALQYVATHIGHSRKRQLSPQERLSLMTQGQYGIGLLGFWSLGERLEMRSSVPGDRPHRLVLYRDRPGYLIEPLREHLPLGDRWTEIVVAELDEAATVATHGKRAADYLAAELRGQLLGRDVVLEVEDRLARGGAGKAIRVTPAPLPGRPIAGLASIEVAGHGTATVDIGLWDGRPEQCPGIAVYCGGTRVAETLCGLGGLGLDRPPWSDPRLSGTIEYPAFTVPPGSRDGVLPNEGAAAFARALEEVEPAIASALEELERAQAERAERAVLRDLRAAFGQVARRRPGLALIPPPGADADAAEHAPKVAAPISESRRARPPGLLPPGPLAEIVVRPDVLVLPRGAQLTLRASCRDALGHEVAVPVALRWSAEGAFATVVPVDEDAACAVLSAGDDAGRGTLRVTGRAEGREAVATVGYEVLGRAVLRDPGTIVPDPAWVDDPEGAWRSRIAASRWEVNAAHPDFVAAEAPASKLKYLSLLLAKDLASRAAAACPGADAAEIMVEILAAAEAAYARRAVSPVRSPLR